MALARRPPALVLFASGLVFAGLEKVVGIVVQGVDRAGSVGDCAVVHVRRFFEFSEIVECDAQEGEGGGIVGVRLDIGAQLLLGGGEIAVLQGCEGVADEGTILG